MKLEDYSKYYIQGSDHYLIPKDIFVELFNEMINWKEENKKLKQWDNNKDGRNSRQRIANKKLHKENEQLKARLELFENGVYFARENDKLEEENNKLKEQLEKYENPEDMTLMMMWATEKVKDENKELKKQQQEFIKYLEDFISKTDYEVNIIGNYLYLAWSKAYKKVLEKYKETIGVKNENNT